MDQPEKGILEAPPPDVKNEMMLKIVQSISNTSVYNLTKELRWDVPWSGILHFGSLLLGLVKSYWCRVFKI